MPPWPVDDRRFRELLGGMCHEVVKLAGFDSRAQVSQVGGGRESAAVFCGDPAVFEERHPDLMPDYGPEGARCVDIWIQVEWAAGRVRASVEGDDVVDWLRRHGRDGEARRIEQASDLEDAMDAVSEGLARMLGESDV